MSKNILQKIKELVAKPIMQTFIIEILDESVKQGKINPTQRDLIIEVGAEIGKIKIKK